MCRSSESGSFRKHFGYFLSHLDSKDPVNEKLHTELWISWASQLRSYAAAHGLNSNQFAVIEFGENEIILRIDNKWTRFTHAEQESSNGKKSIFALNENGTVTLDGKIEEIDFAAERITRDLMSP
jgi:hypothetical protein